VSRFFLRKTALSLFLFLFLLPTSSIAKVYDCFPFFNECDILEVRLNELDSVVDYFVLVEATKTFQNGDKPLYFKENMERFKEFLPKIIHIVVDDMPSGVSWDREFYQCNCIKRGLTNCAPDDVILWGDLDEIPRAEKVKEYAPIVQKHLGAIYFFRQPMFNFYLNMKANNPGGIGWVGTGISSYAYMKDIGRFEYREVIRHGSQRIDNGGWHFTWLGGFEKIVLKKESFSHSDWHTPEQKSVRYIFQRVAPFFDDIMPIDNTFPKYIQDHVDYFTKIGFIAKKDKQWLYQQYYSHRIDKQTAAKKKWSK